MAYGDELVLVDDFFLIGPRGCILLVRNLPTESDRKSLRQLKSPNGRKSKGPSRVVCRRLER